MISKSIPTLYKEHQFDSLLEGRWAAFFDLLGWEWESQPRTEFGVWWKPDFRLTVPLSDGRTEHFYVEVKPRKFIEEAWEYIDMSSHTGRSLIVIDKPYQSAERFAIGQFRQRGASRDAIIVDSHQHFEELKEHWNRIEKNIHPPPQRPEPGRPPPDLFRIELPGSPERPGRRWRLAAAPLGSRSPQPVRRPPDRSVQAPSSPISSGNGRRRPILLVGVALLLAAIPVVLFLVITNRPDNDAGGPVVDRNCADFSTWQEAQDFYEAQGGPQSDPHELDDNGDGIVCEDLREESQERDATVTTQPTDRPLVDRDCADFSTQEEAQAFYDSQDNPSSDPHRLDNDGDGVACQSLPSRQQQSR